MIVRCATTNAGKLREFRLAGERLAPNRMTIETLENLAAIAPPEETGDTFEANAILKAIYYSHFTPDYVFADDSGLEVDALGGAPGVHSARYAGLHGGDAANNHLLLKRLHGITARDAQFVCVIALARAGTLIATFSGVVRGQIMDHPQGAEGFGYDPLFYYPPFECTFGQASIESKMQVSHRAQALFRFIPYLAGLENE